MNKLIIILPILLVLTIPFSVQAQLKQKVQYVNTKDFSRIDSLENEISILNHELDSRFQNSQEKRYQFILDQSEKSLNLANRMINWTIMFVTIFTAILTVLIVFAGFVGFREIRQIQKIKKNVRRTLDSHTSEYKSLIKKIETETEGNMNELRNKIEYESKVFVEVNYNFNEANTAYDNGAFDKAIEYWKRVLEKKPTDPITLCRIGRAYCNLDEFEKAEQAFNNAIQIDKNSREVYHGLATAYRYKDINKAVEYCSRAIEIDSNYAAAYDYLGLLYRELGKIDDAIESHKSALNIRDSEDTHYHLSLLYLKKDQKINAENHIKIANSKAQINLKEGKRVIWAYFIQSGFNTFQKNHDSALDLLQKCADLNLTKRLKKAMSTHIIFLLQALGDEENLQRYKEILS